MRIWQHVGVQKAFLQGKATASRGGALADHSDQYYDHHDCEYDCACTKVMRTLTMTIMMVLRSSLPLSRRRGLLRAG